MVAPFEAATGVDVQFTGTRDINTVLSTGVASGHPARRGRSPRAGPDDRVGQGRRAQAARRRPRRRHLQGRDRPRARRARHGRRRHLRRLHQGGRQGPDLVQPGGLRRVASRPAGTPSDRHGHRRPPPTCGASVSSPAPRPAGPAPTGSRTSSSARAGPTSTTPGSPGPRSGPHPRSRPRSRPSARPSSNSFGGSDAVLTTNFGDGGNQLFTDPPGCLFHHQASFITDFFKNQGGAAGRPVRLLPDARTSTPPTRVPRPAPATCSGCSTTPRRRGP